MRTKPRMRQVLVYCEGCGMGPKIMYEPARAAVRAKTPRTRFIHEACRSKAWREKRKAERLAQATPKPCGRPGCLEMIPPQTGRGRSRVYHSDECRKRAWLERDRTTPAGSVQLADAEARHLAVRAKAAHAMVEQLRVRRDGVWGISRAKDVDEWLAIMRARESSEKDLTAAEAAARRADAAAEEAQAVVQRHRERLATRAAQARRRRAEVRAADEA